MAQLSPVMSRSNCWCLPPIATHIVPLLSSAVLDSQALVDTAPLLLTVSALPTTTPDYLYLVVQTLPRSLLNRM